MDQVVAVTEPAAFSAKGVTAFLKTVKKVQSLPHLNPALEFLGIINVTSSPMTGEHNFQIGELESEYGTERAFIPDFLGIGNNPSGRIYRTGTWAG